MDGERKSVELHYSNNNSGSDKEGTKCSGTQNFTLLSSLLFISLDFMYNVWCGC